MSELTNEEVIMWLKRKWSKMYKELREHGPDTNPKELTKLNMEYSRKRRIYERMIWELGNPNDLLIKK